MTPDETVMLARYVRALCPQQKFDEFTPDAWHDVLEDFSLLECRSAAAEMARRQPFVSPAEIIAVIRQRRGDNARDIQGPGLPAAIPDADPDDVEAYLAAVREQRTKAALGLDLKPRPVAELLAGVGRQVPDEDDEEASARGPMGVECPYCRAKPLRACQSPGKRRLAAFHPGRIESARRVEAGQVPIDQEAMRREVERRKAASRAALAELQATDTADGEAS